MQLTPELLKQKNYGDHTSRLINAIWLLTA